MESERSSFEIIQEKNDIQLAVFNIFISEKIIRESQLADFMGKYGGDISGDIIKFKEDNNLITTEGIINKLADKYREIVKTGEFESLEVYA